MHVLPICLSLIIAAVSYAAAQTSSSASGASSALYPPGLQPLINKANVLLSSGKFNEAIRAYSEAIGAFFC